MYLLPLVLVGCSGPIRSTPALWYTHFDCIRVELIAADMYELAVSAILQHFFHLLSRASPPLMVGEHVQGLSNAIMANAVDFLNDLNAFIQGRYELACFLMVHLICTSIVFIALCYSAYAGFLGSICIIWHAASLYISQC